MPTEFRYMINSNGSNSAAPQSQCNLQSFPHASNASGVTQTTQPAAQSSDAHVQRQIDTSVNRGQQQRGATVQSIENVNNASHVTQASRPDQLSVNTDLPFSARTPQTSPHNSQSLLNQHRVNTVPVFYTESSNNISNTVNPNSHASSPMFRPYDNNDSPSQSRAHTPRRPVESQQNTAIYTPPCNTPFRSRSRSVHRGPNSQSRTSSPLTNMP